MEAYDLIRRPFWVLGLLIILSEGCSELNSLMQSVPVDLPLTEAEVADGIREALITGSKNASSVLSAVDGYYRDELVRIMLPEEAAVIIDNIGKIPGGNQLLEEAVLNINRAAEDAAGEVAPVFINSIRQMSISDAFGILNGADNAATAYLINTTRASLYSLYVPKIKQSTEKALIGGVSAKDSWEALTGKWNQFANSLAGKLAGFSPVTTDLDDYLTNKALDGVFLKIQDEEKNIRQNVSARVTPLLKKVFGSLGQ